VIYVRWCNQTGVGGLVQAVIRPFERVIVGRHLVKRSPPFSAGTISRSETPTGYYFAAGSSAHLSNDPSTVLVKPNFDRVLS
jgi:hypothetical protein